MAYLCRAQREKSLTTRLAIPQPGGTATRPFGNFWLDHRQITARAICRNHPDGTLTFDCVGLNTEGNGESQPSLAELIMEVRPENANELSPRLNASITGFFVDYTIKSSVSADAWKSLPPQTNLTIRFIIKILLPQPCPYLLEKQELERSVYNARAGAVVIDVEGVGPDVVTIRSNGGLEKQIDKETFLRASPAFIALFGTECQETISGRLELPWVCDQALQVIWCYFSFSPNLRNAVESANFKTLKDVAFFAGQFMLKDLMMLAIFALPRIADFNNMKKIERFLSFFDETPRSVRNEVKELVEGSYPEMLQELMNGRDQLSP